MGGPVAITEYTESGSIGAQNLVVAITLTAGSDAASVTVKSGGSSGTTVLTLKAAADTTVVFAPAAPFTVGTSGYLTFTGTSPVASVMYV